MKEEMQARRQAKGEQDAPDERKVTVVIRVLFELGLLLLELGDGGLLASLLRLGC
jgi:hypothetical protein